jgi:hypothetical protein
LIYQDPGRVGWDLPTEAVAGRPDAFPTMPGVTMPAEESISSERARRRAQAISRWNNEGGAGEGGLMHPAAPELPSDEALPLTNAELVQLQIRVIALENLLAVLLAEATEHQLELARDIAAYISPRPGHTPHPLTIHAAARMIGLIERAVHLRDPQSETTETLRPSGTGPSP